MKAKSKKPAAPANIGYLNTFLCLEYNNHYSLER